MASKSLAPVRPPWRDPGRARGRPPGRGRHAPRDVTRRRGPARRGRRDPDPRHRPDHRARRRSCPAQPGARQPQAGCPGGPADPALPGPGGVTRERAGRAAGRGAGRRARWTSAEALTCPGPAPAPGGARAPARWLRAGPDLRRVRLAGHAGRGRTARAAGEAQFTSENPRRRAAADRGDLRLDRPWSKAETTDDGLALTLATGPRIEADRVLLASGRAPRLSGLGLEELAITAGPGENAAAGRDLPVVPKRPR